MQQYTPSKYPRKGRFWRRHRISRRYTSLNLRMSFVGDQWREVQAQPLVTAVLAEALLQTPVLIPRVINGVSSGKSHYCPAFSQMLIPSRRYSLRVGVQLQGPDRTQAYPVEHLFMALLDGLTKVKSSWWELEMTDAGRNSRSGQGKMAERIASELAGNGILEDDQLLQCIQDDRRLKYYPTTCW